MGDNDYENLNGWIPILLQNPPGSGQFVRDSWVSWWEHRGRGSLGGVDCVANIGTPIYAPANCYIQNIDRNAGGSGGRTVTATYNDGWKDQFMHLQSFVTAGSKQKGTVIGYTGNSVADGYDPVAQHLHWHRIDPAGSKQNYNGVYDPYGPTPRRNPFYYFAGSGGAGGGVTPIGDDEEMISAETQAWIIADANARAQATIEQILGYGTGGVNGVPKPATLGDQVKKIRDDIGYIHTGSPHSLKAIQTGVGGVPAAVKTALDATGVRLTDAQEAELIQRIVDAL